MNRESEILRNKVLRKSKHSKIKLTIIAKIRETHTLCSSSPRAVSVIMNTRCAWAGGSFMLFTVFVLANVIYFEEFMIHYSSTDSVNYSSKFHVNRESEILRNKVLRKSKHSK